MSVAYGEIARVLRGARRRQIRVVALAAAGFGFSAVLLSLFAGAVALALGARIGARAVALAGCATFLAAAAAVAVRALARTAWSDEAAARTVARSEAGLRSDLVSSVQLSRARPEIEASDRFSLALVDGHLGRTAQRVRAVDIARAVPDRWARLGGLALLGVAVLHGATLLAAGLPFARAYGRVLAGDPAGARAAAADPITGDVEITYRYPAYMRREPRTLSGTGGEIRAPKGTDVTLSTRADRQVKRAEIAIDPPTGPAEGSKGPAEKRFALTVKDGRDLSGRILVEEGGSYRFRFLDARGKLVAEGPPVPIAVEEDAFPQARIVEPGQEIEVEPGAVVHVEWQVEDDFGVEEVALVVKPPAGEEERRVVRKSAPVRRDSGSSELDLAPARLAEGERLTYWIEAQDGDTVSGPKKGVSEVHTVKIYSEAEHRRAVLDKAKAVLEETIVLLADRLDAFAKGPVATPDRLPVADQLDVRTRHLHERMRETAREIRRDKTGPRPLATALENVAGQIRVAEQRVVNARAPIAQAFRIRTSPDRVAVGTMKIFDAQLDEALEKGILYLEQLLDKQRAEDLVRLAKDLAKSRREMGDLLERYRAAPTEQARKELVARISRMKERLRDLLAKMGELSRGFSDEHMNQEALAEMSKSRDLVGGLDEVERLLAKGDVEGAMKALDGMASAMDEMLAGLERTAGLPDEKARALWKDMLAFKEELEQVQREQQRAAADTDAIRERYRGALQRRMKDAEESVKRLEKLAGEARRDVGASEPGVTYRAEPEYEQSRDSLADLERALGTREMNAAWEMAQRAAPAVERLALFLEEDVALAERSPTATRKAPERVREAARQAARAVPKARAIRDELSRMFPDPRQVLSQEEQDRLGALARKQTQLEQRAGDLQRQLQELMQKAPVFPPSAPGQLGESRGHMNQAAAELGARNPQRGHGEQELALDALSRFQKGLEEASKRGRGTGGAGFPFPFAASDDREGDGMEPSHEKVAIPGAEAHRVPEEFRKDLLDAMRQGTPERYRSEVQRYYEELVK